MRLLVTLVLLTGLASAQSAFYVSPNGSDSNPGTLAAPFLTLGKAQSAMQAGATKLTYLRAGTYKPAPTGKTCMNGNASGESITLTAADNGETWSYYPPDGLATAILDGQSTQGTSGNTGGNGTGCGFGGFNVSNISIIGLQFENYLYSAFWINTGSGLVFSENTVHDLTGAAWSAGGVGTDCAPGTQVTNNYFYNLAYAATDLETNSGCPTGISNVTVAGNVVENACTWPAVSGFGNDQNGGDCGAIYFADVSSTSTNVQVTNNYVRDVNASSSGAGDNGANGQNGCCALGVYLDNGASHATISGNILAGTMSGCVMIHGGSGNTLTGNICNIDNSTYQSIVIYGAAKSGLMLSNSFTHNIVIADTTGQGAGYYGTTKTPNPMTISDNAYYNYVGSTVKTTGNSAVGSDSSPTYENPELSGWIYTVASNSPVFQAPVSFPVIVGEWGPPGFSVPPASAQALLARVQ